jgi:phosphohistidine swiveling domain-containing protein
MLRDSKQHPEMSEQEIVAPIVLTSLPRTGSTKLHKMLAASGDFLFLAAWQGFSLGLRTGNRGKHPAPRIRESDKYDRWFKARAPEGKRIHDYSTLEPDGAAADPYLTATAPDVHWTTVNIGEAVPGVLTPLSASVWAPAFEYAALGCAHAVGAISSRERKVPPAPLEPPMLRTFYGRVAMQVAFFSMLGDRMPGTSGAAVVEGVLGHVPTDLHLSPTNRRYPVVAVRLPVTFLTIPRRVRAAARAMESWYHAELARVPTLSRSGAIGAFADATKRFDAALYLQGVSLFGAVQPMYDVLAGLVAKTGHGDVAVLSGSGGAEMSGLVADLWSASRAQTDVDEVVRRNGFHGPREGELSSRVWREDDGPLRQLVAQYRTQPDSSDPAVREKESERARRELAHEILAVTPMFKRTARRTTLKLAAELIPLRGVGKRSFLMALDVARAAARRAGECMVADGALSDPGDVFYLTAEELIGNLPQEVTDRVARRRAWRAECEQLNLPVDWRGMPEPSAVTADTKTANSEIRGIGVSAGVVEGIARVVTDPDFAEFEPGEILVAAFTDPGWASVMFIASALVVDIGGALSHAAVVARELRLPCVVNTHSGTRTVQSGDLIRVDGTSGAVTILKRATEKPHR